MTRDVRLYLQDILDSIEKIQRYTENLTLEEFKANDMVIDAVARNFEIIGEAATQMPDDFKERHPEILWHQMKGIRNVIAHEYFGVRLATIWETVCNDLPNLASQIKQLIRQNNR